LFQQVSAGTAIACLLAEENSMSEVNPVPAKKSLQIPILFGLVIALAVANVVLFVWMETLKRDMAEIRGSLLSEVTKLRESHSLSTATSRQSLDELRAELARAREQAAAAAGQARAEALKHADQLARRIQEEQLRQQAQVRSELTEVQQAATTANTRISDVSSDVNTVRSEVASTRSELEKTIAELKSVRGDLGVQSGLIATNATELAALKALGERDYFEFDLRKTKQHQRVGSILVLLKKADTKRNRYTVELIADDKKIEKKEKSLNEPVQFYVAGARQPYELVVNEIRKDQIIGYLAVPKVSMARGS